MENKTTTELLDLLQKKIGPDGQLKEGYEEILEELRSREPFYSLWKPVNDATIAEELEAVWSAIKELRRHKHDERTGDVMIRI